MLKVVFTPEEQRLVLAASTGPESKFDELLRYRFKQTGFLKTVQPFQAEARGMSVLHHYTKSAETLDAILKDGFDFSFTKGYHGSGVYAVPESSLPATSDWMRNKQHLRGEADYLHIEIQLKEGTRVLDLSSEFLERLTEAYLWEKRHYWEVLQQLDPLKRASKPPISLFNRPSTVNIENLAIRLFGNELNIDAYLYFWDVAKTPAVIIKNPDAIRGLRHVRE